MNLSRCIGSLSAGELSVIPGPEIPYSKYNIYLIDKNFKNSNYINNIIIIYFYDNFIILLNIIIQAIKSRIYISRK